MSKQQRKRNANEFDNRIRWYSLPTPAVLTISHIGIETMPDLFASEPTRGEIITDTEGDDFNPYARPERKKGDPLPTKDMPVLWFKETGSRKSLVLNSTNRRALIEKHGADFDAWKGKLVTLSAGKTRQGKNTVILQPGNTIKERANKQTGEIIESGEPVGLGELMNPNI